MEKALQLHQFSTAYATRRVAAPSLNRAVILLAIVFVALAGGAFAQTYPSKPLRMIQSLGVGGGSEPMARIMSQRLSEALGQPVVMESHGGAGGSIGLNMVARAAPDGYTIGFASSSGMVLRKFISKNVPYEVLRDFTHIMALAEPLACLVVNPALGLNTLQEALDYAKRNPSKMHYGSSGIGTVHHLSGVVVSNLAGGVLTHVPYKSGGDSLNGLLGGQVQLVFGILGTMVPQAKAGKVKILAINFGQRFSRLPDVPTIGEVLPGYERPPGWNGFVAPAGLPAPITRRLYEDLSRIANSPDVAEKLLDLGFQVDTLSPDQFSAQLKRSLEISERIIKAAKVEAE